jgi:hypothetical protein
MPDLVVPSFAGPRWRSYTTSSSWWYGRMRWALPLTTRFDVSMPAAVEHVELAEQDARVDDHPVADDVHGAGVEDAARHEPHGEALLAHHDRVPGVVAALVADDHVHVTGEDVGELALPLVTPLGADHHGPGHVPALLVDGGTPNPTAARAAVGPPPDGSGGGWRHLGLRQHDAVGPASTRTVSPSPYVPCSSAMDSGSVIARCRRRLSGRAPKAGS